MELTAIVLFCLALVTCVAFGWSVVVGLVAGLVIFAFYALLRGFSLKEVALMVAHGCRGARDVLVVFACIGVLTGIWRASGTISALVNISTLLCIPSVWPLIAFLLNCAVSFLIGTAFGTAAIMGVVCMTIGNALGCDAALMGGAIISGCYFGDRISPVSSSALLVAELTSTIVPDNIIGMLKSAAVPFALSCALFAIIGFKPNAASFTAGIDVGMGFYQGFVVFLPAIAVLISSLARVRAAIALLAGSAIAVVVCLVFQGQAVFAVAAAAGMGFVAQGQQSALLDGGGLISMASPAAIVCIASAYAGIFAETGMLRNLQNGLANLSRRITPFGSCVVAAMATAALACNQTLSIMLTHDLCCNLADDGSELAIFLENSAVVMAPLVPWSIAATVPLSAVGAPMLSLAFSFYLYLLPLCSWARAMVLRYA